MAALTISLTGSAVVTGSKSYAVNDTDIQSLLDTMAVLFGPYLQATFNPSNAPGFVPTNQQIMLAWIQGWINETKASVQRFKTPAPVAPAAITIT